MNPAKCYVITFKNKKEIEHDYDITNWQTFKKVKQIWTLRLVLIDNKLSFEAHVDMIAKKSIRMLIFLFRIGNRKY